MNSFNQKFEILESIGSLDQVQTEQVLLYIKDLKSNLATTARQKARREAMKQIRQALQSEITV